MRASLWNHLLLMPSARDVISRTVDGLANQVSQLLLVPATVECPMGGILRSRLERLHLREILESLSAKPGRIVNGPGLVYRKADPPAGASPPAD